MVCVFDLLYDSNSCVKDKTGLDPKVENILWDFNEGIGPYVDKVLSGRMSIAESLKDHMQIIEDWVKKVETTLANI